MVRGGEYRCCLPPVPRLYPDGVVRVTQAWSSGLGEFCTKLRMLVC